MSAADDYPKSARYAAAYGEAFPDSQPAEVATMLAEIDQLRAIVGRLRYEQADTAKRLAFFDAGFEPDEFDERVANWIAFQRSEGRLTEWVQTTPRVQVGWSKYNGAGETIFAMRGHEAHDDEMIADGWKRVYRA